MTDPDQPYDLTVMTAIRAGLWRVKEEKEVLLLLAGLVTVITVVFYGLTMGNMFVALSASTSGEALDPAAFQSGLGLAYWPSTILYMLLYFGPLLVWARVSMLGRDAALEDGFGALAQRVLWALWRYIGMMGWMLLLVFALTIVGILIGLIFGIAGGFGSLTGGGIEPAAGMSTGFLILIIPLYLAMILIMLVLMGAWMVSINAEARDTHLSINKAFKVLGGRAWACA